MDWSKNIKALREKLLITQSELGEKLGVSFGTINRWENGHFEPTMKMKRELVKLFKKNKIGVE